MSETSSLAQATRIVVITSWIALGLGLLGSTPALRDRPALGVAAAVTSGVFVAIVTLLPHSRLTSSNLQLEILIVAGAVLTAASTTLTGGLESPYVLMSLMPTLLGSIAGGYRLGLTTSLLSAGLLTGVVASTGGLAALAADFGTIALFPLLSVVVAQVRKLLLEVEEKATTLEQASLAAEAEVERLGHANELLRRLTDVYAEGSSNPVEVGRSAIEAIVDSLPGSFATATLFDAQGPVVVARAGTDSPEHVRTQFPLGDGETTSGVVSLGTPRSLTAEETSQIEQLLRPVAVSFANAVLLQEIAGEAVQEERLRLARELHDEVGPALAALGFAMDGLSLQAEDPDLSEEIGEVRQSLGNVVEDLRGIIADLRSDESGSITAAVNAAAAKLDGDTEIVVDLHERRPPRSTAARQILAIVTEAMRNAHRHAEAERISVSGLIDRQAAEVEISDDGRGFDPTRLPEGHYGVMGMRERADRIGATVDIESSDKGTTVRVVWKERR